MEFGKLIGQNLSVGGKIFELDRSVNLLGRGRDCTLVILDPSVSRMHAKITVNENNQLVIEDLNSSNGTFVNDRRISSTVLHHGDRIRIGNVEFILEIPGEASKKSAAAYIEQEEEIEEEGGGKGMLILIILLVVVLLGGGGAAAYFFIFNKEKPATAWMNEIDTYKKKIDKVAKSAKDEYRDKAYKKALDLKAKKDFEKSGELLSNILKIFPDDEDAKEELKKVKDELENKQRLEKVKKYVQDEDYKAAIKLLKEIKKGSVFYNQAQTELSSYKDIKDAILNDARTYCAKKDMKNCKKFIENVLAIDPSDTEALKLKKRYLK